MLAIQAYGDMPVPRIMKKMGMAAMSLSGKDDSFKYEFLRRASLGQPVFWGGADGFPDRMKQRILSPRLRKNLSGLTSWEAIKGIRRNFEEKAWDKSHLNWMTYADLNVRLPELLLMRVDKMSMGVSLEGRVPFLDHKFVELAMSIPSEMKLRNGTLKHMLKKAVRGVIPDEIIDRKKQGFGVPVKEWIFEKLGDQASKDLVKFCADTDVLDPAEVRKLIDQKRYDHVWQLLNFSLWWKSYMA
jgi:asparagine synthase (glutamine-hydrolysing)